MDYKEIDIFSPLTFVLLVIIYLLFSFVGFHFHLKELVGLENNTVLIVFSGLIFYILGLLIVRHLFKNKTLSLNEERLEKLTSERIVLALAIIGILLQIINFIYLGGIPIFSGYLKARAATRIWLLSYLLVLPSINILIARSKNNKYLIVFLIALMLFALTGYRTTAMAIVISVLITIYYTRKLPWKYLTLAILAIFVLLLAVGYIAVQSIEWQTWTLGPLQLLFYRAGYTLQVLDHVVTLQGSTQGQLLYNTLTGFLKSTDPRVIVGSTTLGYEHSTTSTIFGPALLDFGLYAMLIQMTLLGLIMGFVYYVQRNLGSIFVALYAMLFAHVLIWIETGPTDLVIFLFFIISLILILTTVKIRRNE